VSRYDERTIHRLEAFSDIVMGFALAEIGLSLVLPQTPAALGRMGIALNAFAFSFFLIAVMWWSHHRLFLFYFTLNAASIIMNFAMLACLALAIFFQQAFVRFMDTNQSPIEAFQLWLGFMAAVYALLGAMYAVGIVKRWRQLDDQTLTSGISYAMGSAIGTIGLIAICAIAPHGLGKAVWVSLAVALAGIARRIAAPRITAALLRNRQASTPA